MFTPADLPDIVPVFPLPGALVLPRGHLPLHIFEPRYLAMLEDVLKTSHRLIGMIQPLPGEGRLHTIGSAGRITQFTETDDGRYMVTWPSSDNRREYARSYNPTTIPCACWSPQPWLSSYSPAW